MTLVARLIQTNLTTNPIPLCSKIQTHAPLLPWFSISHGWSFFADLLTGCFGEISHEYNHSFGRRESPLPAFLMFTNNLRACFGLYL